MIDFPVLQVKMIPTDKIQPNDYNPNKVATPEMKLLLLSIKEDGYTQPIVTYYDKDNDKYIIVDGFHRYTVGKEYLKLKELPCTVINKDLAHRMASTIRHNRARGSHQIKGMSRIVIDLLSKGWTEAEVSNDLGMELDEVIVLKRADMLKEDHLHHQFSPSWSVAKEKIESKLKDNEKSDKAL